MNKDQIKKTLASLGMAGLIASVSVMGVGCSKSGETGKSEEAVQGQSSCGAAKADSAKQGSCGQGSCGQDAKQDTAKQGSCGQGSCSR